MVPVAGEEARRVDLGAHCVALEVLVVGAGARGQLDLFLEAVDLPGLGGDVQLAAVLPGAVDAVARDVGAHLREVRDAGLREAHKVVGPVREVVGETVRE